MYNLSIFIVVTYFICNTTPSTTSSSELWHQLMSHQCEPNPLSRYDGKRPDGSTVLSWANGRCMVWDFTCPDTLATITCYVPALLRTRLEVGKWWNTAHCRLDTASHQWRSSHLARWARRRPTSSAISDTGSRLWQLSQGHSGSWCSGWVSLCNVVTPRVWWELFRLQSDWRTVI